MTVLKKIFAYLELLSGYFHGTDCDKTSCYRYIGGAVGIGLMISATLIVYSNTFYSPFVFDDWRSIENNQHIRLTDLSTASIKKLIVNNFLPNRALPNLSFGLNYYFHQYRLPGYHLVNILIHIFTGIFLYLFVRQLFSLSSGDKPGRYFDKLAFATALLWLINPIQTQSVNYIVQRMNLMAAMFYLIAMVLYVQGRRMDWGYLKSVNIAGSLFAMAFALLSKENAATLPFFILILEWYFFQDLKVDWLIKRALPVVAVLSVVVLIMVDLNPIDFVKSSYRIRDFTVFQRLMTEFRVVVFYLSLVYLPLTSRLNFEHDFPVSLSLLNPPSTLLSLLVIVVLLFAACRLAKKERLVSFCLLWFLGNLVIESSVIGLELVFEHRIYLPSMMVILLAVIFVHRFLRTKWLAVTVLILVFFSTAVLAYERNKVWRDEVSLYRDCVEKSPNKVRPRFTLGGAYDRQGQPQQAISQLKMVLGYKDIDNTEKLMTHSNLANLLWRQRYYQEAVDHFFEVFSLDTKDARIVLSLAKVYEEQGKKIEALFFFQEAIRIQPGYADSYNELGRFLIFQGDFDRANLYLTQALRLRPNFQDALKNMQILLAYRKKRMDMRF
jgi:tetratricopeptide (TPR) repeat protein